MVQAIALTCFALLWAGGMLSYLALGGPPPGSEWTAPAFLFVAAAGVLLSLPGHGAFSLLAAGMAAWAVEVVGVKTGLPFGNYTYTSVLGIRELGVPLAIGAAWIVLLAYTLETLRRWKVKAQLRPWIGAAWMTAMDFIIDPVAAGPLNYWGWSGGGWYYHVPWSNFLGWFIVSLLLLVFLARRDATPSRAVRLVGLAILVFFGVLNAREGYRLPVLFSVLCIALDALAERSRRSHT